MTTPDEIESAARRNDTMPDNLTQPEQLLFLQFRALYEQYRAGTIERDKAKTEKQMLLKEFRAARIQDEIRRETANMRARLGMTLSEMQKSECELCRRAARIIDGLER